MASKNKKPSWFEVGGKWNGKMIAGATKVIPGANTMTPEARLAAYTADLKAKLAGDLPKKHTHRPSEYRNMLRRDLTIAEAKAAPKTV